MSRVQKALQALNEKAHKPKSQRDPSLVVSLVLLAVSIAAIVFAFTMACGTLNVEAEKSFVVHVQEDPCDFRVVIDGTERFHGWSKSLKCVFNIQEAP